ncbi:MAG: asparagine synthetase B family protein [Pseudomonadota bacterium]
MVSGALLAKIHRDPEPRRNDPAAQRAFDERLARARLRLDQPQKCFAWQGLRVGALGHPLRPEAKHDNEDFEPLIELDSRHVGLVWGQLDPDGPTTREALELLAARGPQVAEWFSGSYVMMLIDRVEGTLRLLRDPLGTRGAFIAETEDARWVATDERMLWPDQPQPEPAYLASVFAAEPPPPSLSPIAGVSSLPPGHWLQLTPDTNPTPQRYWRFHYDPTVRRLSAADQREGLLENLRSAVAATRSDGDAVAISGGLDSPAAAALSDLRQALTYRIERWPECGEHNLAKRVCDDLGLALTEIDCDDAEPLGDAFEKTPTLACGPELDAYQALRWRLAVRARQQGHRGVLTGDFADQLYLGYPYALRDSFFRQPLASLGTLAKRLRATPAFWRDPTVRRLGPLNGISRGRRSPVRPWLTDHSRSLLTTAGRDHPIYGPITQIDRVEGCLNSSTARAAHLGYLQGLAWGVEYRFPYRQWKLVQFFLSLPAHCWLDPHTGATKPVTRQAMRGRLPAAVTERLAKTSLEPMFRQAVLKDHWDKVQEALSLAEHWQPYIDPAWLEERQQKNDWSGFSLYVLWCCVSAARWLQNFTGRHRG